MESGWDFRCGAKPYQTIPLPGTSWKAEGDPARQAHQYIRGKTAKLLTLFRPATGELRAEPVDASTNAILHPWLKEELEKILNRCPPVPEQAHEGKRWQDWDCYPSADQLDRWFPPIRVLLILDNLMGHRSRDLTQWCAEHGVCLLYTPNAGSWLNMAESVQRIIVRRALEGYHIYDVEILKDWLLPDGIGILPHSSGAASVMHDAIGHMRVVTVWEGQERPLSTFCPSGFVLCASTSMS